MSGFTLRHARLLDSSGGFTRPTDLRVRGALIEEIKTDPAVDATAPDIDFTGLFLLPGIIDTHVHAVTHSHDPWEQLHTSYGYRIAEKLNGLKRTLHAGVMTMRDAGGLDAGIRDAESAGLMDGPKLQVSVVPLSPTGYQSRSEAGAGCVNTAWARRADRHCGNHAHARPGARCDFDGNARAPPHPGRPDHRNPPWRAAVGNMYSHCVIRYGSRAG